LTPGDVLMIGFDIRNPSRLIIGHWLFVTPVYYTPAEEKCKDNDKYSVLGLEMLNFLHLADPMGKYTPLRQNSQVFSVLVSLVWESPPT